MWRTGYLEAVIAALFMIEKVRKKHSSLSVGTGLVNDWDCTFIQWVTVKSPKRISSFVHIY